MALAWRATRGHMTVLVVDHDLIQLMIYFQHQPNATVPQYNAAGAVDSGASGHVGEKRQKLELLCF